MSADHSFSVVMDRLKAGDEQAASEIFRRFVDRLIALAACQFEERFWAKADPEEVVQSVYQSFFRRQDRSPFDLSDWDSLWALLAMITIRKCHRELNFWKAAKRDTRRELPTGNHPDAEACWEVIDREPTPDQATVLAETLQRLLVPFQPRQREIAELILQGYTAPEIAPKCRCSERTVYRVDQRLRERILEIETDASEA